MAFSVIENIYLSVLLWKELKEKKIVFMTENNDALPGSQRNSLAVICTWSEWQFTRIKVGADGFT